jgi:hypothetical protein
MVMKANPMTRPCVCPYALLASARLLIFRILVFISIPIMASTVGTAGESIEDGACDFRSDSF